MTQKKLYRHVMTIFYQKILTKAGRRASRVGFHVLTAQSSWEYFFFWFVFLPGSLTGGTCFGLAIHNINTKISVLPDVLQNILFVKYFKFLQMRRNLYCCVLLTRNQQELFHSQLSTAGSHWGVFAGWFLHERHVGLTHVHIYQHK